MTTLPGDFADHISRSAVAPAGASRPQAATPRVPTSGLYDPRFEHDACGIALVADLHGRPTHALVRRAITALEHLAHRGATGSEEDSGDGAGILLQIPHQFYREVVEFDLPDGGRYATGIAFLSRDPSEAAKARTGIEQLAEEEGLVVLGWRDVPFDDQTLGSVARGDMPSLHQVFVAAGPTTVLSGDDPALALDRVSFVLRKRAEHQIADCYLASLSARTITYKGMLTSHQLAEFYPDLSDLRVESGLALVHSRFSTNTFPSWALAHPYRYLAHNGEINTLAGNRNWMRAREALCATDLIPGLERAFPILTPGASDSASFDEVLELLHLGGRPLHHAVLMMIPEAWENHRSMDPARRAFYRYHSSLMEPWDGPASVAFTDGTMIGAVLDRNGLRPARYWVTDDGLVVLASEVGVLDVPSSTVIRKGRLQPGRMFLVDTAAGRIIDDDEIKSALSAEQPYAHWLEVGQIDLDDLPPKTMLTPQHASVIGRQREFGYTNEELRLIIGPMAKAGIEPIGSMGHDAAIAVLSERSRLLYDYFTQLFAQVTNPPLDAIREELVTSLESTTGPEQNLFEPGPASCRQIVLPYPVISDSDLAKIVHINDDGDQPGLAACVVDGRYLAAGGGEALRSRLAEIRAEVSAAIAGGARIIVLSDRGTGTGGGSWQQGGGGAAGAAGRPGPAAAALAPVPSLLLTGAVHHHLIDQQTRTRVGLIVESGDARESHHIALLIGYGASSVCPYLAVESVQDMVRRGLLDTTSPEKAAANLIKALGKGVLKIMSKMGVSTIASYTGAQIFEAIGLGDEVIAECFAGTSSRLGGVSFDQLAAEIVRRHARAWPANGAKPAHRRLETGGDYQWRREGEAHLFNPETVFKLQHATRTRQREIFAEYTRLVDDQAARLMTLRGLLRLRGIDDEPAARPGRGPAGPPIPIEEVEPVASIVARFSTGAMSYGSISAGPTRRWLWP